MKKLRNMVKLLIIVLLMIVIGYFIVGYLNYVRATDEVSIEEKVSIIRAQDTYVSIDEISPYLLQATTSIEDRRFYEHHGIDLRSMARALLNNIFAKSIVGGGSTITQQLAKNMYYTYQASYVRKVSEILTALDLEKMFTKQEILELYVNIINYGDNYFGIYEASMGYFGKEPSDLTLAEASLLAGIPQSPSNLQLSNHLEEAQSRQNQVLDAMVRDGWITEEEKESVLADS